MIEDTEKIKRFDEMFRILTDLQTKPEPLKPRDSVTIELLTNVAVNGKAG